MAQTEASVYQNAGSVLSAEAESFVPRRNKKGVGTPGPNAGGAGQGLNQLHKASAGEKDALSSQQISQLPHYLTSCYPFVGNDNPQHNNRNNNGNWQGVGRPSNPNYSEHRMPGPQSGNFPYNGNRAFGPRYPKGPGPIGPGPGPPRHAFPGMPHGLPSGPGLMSAGQSHPGAMGGIPSNPQGLNPYMGFPPHLGLPQGQSWPAPLLPAEYSGQYGDPNMYRDLQAQYQGSANPADWNNSTERTRSSERKKKKKSEASSNMVSIGIQNESGVQHNSGSGSKKKAKTKTIICKNAEIQTDFSDEIANLTLAERPNSLYHKDNRSRSWLQRYNQDSSTDSEEKDSDSGYSSPLHRRNQASNGTHPVVGMPYGQPGLMTGPQGNTGLLPPPGSMFSQFLPPPPSSVAVTYGGYHPTASFMSAGSLYANVTTPYGQPCYPPPPTMQQTAASMHMNPTNKLEASPIVGGHTSATNHPNPLVHCAKTEPEDEETSSGKKKRRRSRRKKHQSSGEDISALSDEPYDLHRAHSSSNVSRTSTIENNLTLHFDDEDEFPNLLSAAGGLPTTPSQSSGPVSYSDILKSQVPSLSQDSSVSSLDRFKYTGAQSGSSTPSEHKLAQGKESKNARKRRKRRELASQAADEELAEISLEQHVLKELSTKAGHKDPGKEKEEKKAPPPEPKVQPAGKKSKQPISLNFADMINALEKQQEKEKLKQSQAPAKPVKQDTAVVNPLDASAPAKRGKEREVPKVKKPSPLKKVILKEREEKKRLRLLDETNPLSPDDSSNSSQLASVAGMPLDSDLSQDAISSKASSSMDFVGTPASADLSPISQTSPISMSPLSGSPLSSGVNSPIAGNNVVGIHAKSSVLMKIHSRRFREYCNQVLDKDIDNSCTALLQDLVRFQDRLYHKDPTKAKSKRRIVLGLREVTKHLKLGRIKVVVISPNLERIQSKGGLDEALTNIMDLCGQQEVPFVFALGRRALGRACAKLVPVSVVGVFSYEGSEENFKRLMDQTEQARAEYLNMLSMLEKEMEEMPRAQRPTNTSSGGFAQLFPHLGHSRTPSACSAISFTSSILSEPISENYPHSEPETDSRGYEIIRKNPMLNSITKVKATEELDNGLTETEPEQAETVEDVESPERSDSPTSSQGKMIIVESLNEYDADTEDDMSNSHRKKAEVSCASALESTTSINDIADHDDIEDIEENLQAPDDTSSEGTNLESQIERDEIQALPHIDSIHSSGGADANVEILSQHSSKTTDLNIEVMSTHSSKTLEGERGGRVTPDRSSRKGSASDLREATSSGGGSQRLRNVDNKERVQSWVAETQKHLERLNIRCSDIEEESSINNNKLPTDNKTNAYDQNNVVACDTDSAVQDRAETQESPTAVNTDTPVLNGTEHSVT